METLATFRNMLRIDRHRLDEELEIQSEIMDRLSQRVISLNTKQLEAKEELSRTEARLTLDVDDGSTKMTAAQVAATVKRHSDRRRAFQLYSEARHEYEEWEALRDAWKGRGFALKTLADLYTSNYFSPSDHKVQDRSDRNRARIDRHQQEHLEGRVAMNAARSERRKLKESKGDMD